MIILKRRALLCATALGATGAFVLGAGTARADTKTGIAAYPTAETIYEAQFVAATKGFFKDAGLDVKLVQGGSGVKAREIVAAGQADIGIGDITHPLQLINHGRAARVLMPVDVRNNGVVFVIRKDLHDQGITTLPALAAWKRPDGRKPIIGVSSLGGTNHVWASYYLELMDIDTKITFIGAGDVETMLGSLKTKQIDVLVNAPALARDAEEHGWGTILFNGSGADEWNKYIGGKVPATAHYTLAATIEADKPKMQAYVTGLWRATQWIGAHSADEVADAIEPYLGSTSHAANVFDVKLMKDITDYTGEVDPQSYQRGAKVWFRELTGIKPMAMSDVVASDFIQAAKKAYPA